jgi:GH24 family phage-related lysozyme (muramidase)
MVIPYRTLESGSSYDLAPEGRATQLDKIYVGFVKSVEDQQRMGRIKVWIPEISGDPADENEWLICSYASPFAGATSVYDNTDQPGWLATQTSYGFWFVPPDLENEVVCCFINGDPSRGIWFGCLYQQNMNHMVPGIPGDKGSNGLPVAEYNKLQSNVVVNTENAPLYLPLSSQLQVQGLDKDSSRGTTDSGARRQEPINLVYGILSPGGSQFVMDDNDVSKYIRLRTQQGTQVLINDTDGFIYMISRDGNSWMELGVDGSVNIYGANDISVRSQGTLNLHADLDINIEAGRSIFMKARGEVSSVLNNASASANPESGEILKATTSSNAVLPAITINETQVIITAPTSGITGQFIEGMDITGIPWDNPTTSAPPSPTSPVANTTPGSGAPVVIIGDANAGGIASDVAQTNPGTLTSSSATATTASVLAAVKGNSNLQSSTNAVVSVGGNDYNDGSTNPGQTTTNLQGIRDSLNAKSYVWILPIDPTARDTVYGFAVGNGDATQDVPLNEDGTPDYATLATNVQGSIIPTQPQTPLPTATSTQTATPPTPPKATLASVNQNTDGTQTILKVTFAPGSQSTASNASVIIGTLQNETTNTNPPVTNNTTTNPGIIMIQAVRDLHMVSNRDMYIRSNGLMARTAKGNMFDYAYGSYDMAAGGYLTMQSNGLFSIGTTNNLVLGGARIDLNGPAPSAAKAAPDALTPIDSQQQDVRVPAPGNITISLVNTITSNFPTHEPFRGHAATAQGFNEHVETGTSVDPYTGQPLKQGQVIGTQDKPLDLKGAPNSSSPPGNYKGQGYDNKGNPQYSYQGAAGDQVAAGSLKTSQAGAQFIAKFEGSKSQVYLDSAGLPTVGIGHLLLPDEKAGNYVTIGGEKVPLNSPLSQDNILKLFQQDLAPREAKVQKSIQVKISQTQFDMLVSFTYNIGNCNALAAILNTGSFDVTEKWMSYCHAAGKVIPGLQTRRSKEVANFCGGNPIGNGGV